MRELRPVHVHAHEKKEGLEIRAARPDEAASLTALAVRSKARWGYDAAFMEAARPELTLSAELIARAAVFVAEREREIVGVYVLSVEAELPTLRDLWVEPAWIGAGVGAALWAHMLEEARARGYPIVRIESDPNAAGFYTRMGATRVGAVASNIIAGRMLPVFEITP